jgi:MFS family permease
VRVEPERPEDERRQTPDPEHRLRPMSPAALSIWAVVGLVAGWVFHRLADRGTGVPPQVPWLQPLALFLVAAILAGTAWSTRRTISQHPGRLSPHQAVNRLVLARACAYVGALAAGVYIGYAVSWLGVTSSDLAGQRAFRSACAGVAGILIVVGGLLLERACRVPPDEDEP